VGYLGFQVWGTCAGIPSGDHGKTGRLN